MDIEEFILNQDFMKKKNKSNIIQDWINKYGTKKIEEQVKTEIEDGILSPLVKANSINTN
ncbi:hypothetical protein Phi19:2_gp095 [Cellulophaga phage phi19:2]|uniref:Uncharacterized protein n=2 Tax=Cellulophaga phage phiST TaxID=756282 RepID=M4T1P7_9CAUD|nr:hypothetical protein CGPG_00015 [Cellulophaga phage phiST]AGH56714.1 hypothetical protein CGPG_00015 [Cellulophaga phage phiST]AGO47234.1 hypothetical protein PhiST_gp095 [Cellulophaga phage phiST]AGO48730.1 hypothetical protein Phi19:2_gp095 [Cellulophaga phage phi19:2]